MHRARPQSARPARRVGNDDNDNDDNDETRDAASRVPTRDIRLNMQDNMSFYKSPILDRRPAGEQTSAARLPVQTRLCGLLERHMTESRIDRFRNRGLVALAQARGPHGDWSDSTSKQLQGLAKMLAHGECTAELTQMVSDPFFLQRRLALSSHSHLLADIDVCQDALTVLIQRERFERRSADSSVALSRRPYLESIRQFIEDKGARLEGPEQARHFLAAALRYESGQGAQPHALAWRHGVRALMLRFNSFVRASHEWLEQQHLPHNRAYQLCLPLRYAPAASMVQAGQAYQAEEGLRHEFARVLVVSAARLRVALVQYSPESCEDMEGFFASVTVEADSQGRGKEAQAVARSLLRLASSPFSDLHMTYSSDGGGGQLAWSSQLLEAPMAATATVALASARTSRSGASEEANLRRARMRCADLCLQHLATALDMRKRLAGAQESGLESCLEAADRAAAHSLLASLSQVLSHSGAAAPLSSRSSTGADHDRVLEVELKLGSVTGVESAGSGWTCDAAEPDTADSVSSDTPVTTDVELWVQELASSLAGSLGVDASLLEVSIVALARQLPSAPPSLSANVAGSAAGSGSSSSSSGHTHASGAGMPPVRLPVAASVSGDVGKRTLVTVRVRVQGSGGYMLLQSTSAQLKKWRDKYDVVSSHLVQGAVRVWLTKPLQGVRAGGWGAPSRGARSATPDAWHDGREDDAQALARALVAASSHSSRPTGLEAVQLDGYSLSKSRRCCSLCVRCGSEHGLLQMLEATMRRQWRSMLHPATGSLRQKAQAPCTSGATEDVGAMEDVERSSMGEEEEEDEEFDAGNELDDAGMRALAHLQDNLFCVETRSTRSSAWQPLRISSRAMAGTGGLAEDGSDVESSADDARREGAAGRRSAADDDARNDSTAKEMRAEEMRVRDREWWLHRHAHQLALQQGIFEVLDRSYCPQMASRDGLVDLILFDLPNLDASSRAHPKVWLVQGPPGAGKSTLLARLSYRFQALARAQGLRGQDGQGDIVISGSKRPGMSLPALCQFLVDELWLHLRGSLHVPPYYTGRGQLDRQQQCPDAPRTQQTDSASRPDEDLQGQAGGEGDEDEGEVPADGLREEGELRGDVSVLHGGNVILSMTPCVEGVSIWADRTDYLLTTLPRILDGSSLVQLPCEVHDRLEIVLRAPATLYVLLPQPLPPQDSLPDSQQQQPDVALVDAADERLDAAGGAGAQAGLGVRSDGGLSGKLAGHGWVRHDATQVIASGAGVDTALTTVLSKTLLRPGAYALPMPDAPASMALAVRLHDDALVVEYDGMGRLVIPDGVNRTTPLRLVSMPATPQDEAAESGIGGDLEEAVPWADSSDALDASCDDDAAAGGGEQSAGGGQENEWRWLMFVVDGVDQGQVLTMLEALGLTDIKEEEADALARKQRRARGTSAPPPPPCSPQDMSSVRLRQLREVARHLLDKSNLRIGVVCATEHVLDHAPWDQDDEPWHTLREPLPLQVAGASLVTLPALSEKEARQVARSHADAAAASSGVGGTLPPAFQTSLKALEDQILPQDRGGAKGKRRHGEGESEGARWPFYLSAAVGSLFAFASAGSSTRTAPTLLAPSPGFPASAFALTDFILNQLDSLLGPRLVCELVHEILYKQEGVSLEDMRALDHLHGDLAAGAPRAAQDKAGREESARMRQSAMHMTGRPRGVVAKDRELALQQATRALGALMYAPFWRLGPDMEDARQVGGTAGTRGEASSIGVSRGRASPDSAKAADNGEAVQWWWEGSGLVKRLVPGNAQVHRRLHVYLLKASVMALMDSQEAASEHDQRVLADLLACLQGPEYVAPLTGIFGRLLARSAHLPTQASSHASRNAVSQAPRGQIDNDGGAPWPPARLVAHKVTGLAITVGWRVSTRGALGAWWEACSRGLYGRVAFRVEILRPASVDTPYMPCDASLPSPQAADVKVWQVQHSRCVEWAAGKQDLMGTFWFEYSINNSQVGELGVEPGAVLVRVATLGEPEPHNGQLAARQAPDAPGDSPGFETSATYQGGGGFVRQSAWQTLMLLVPPVPPAPHVEAQDVSYASCTINWRLPQRAPASRWSPAPAAAHNPPVFRMELRRHVGGDFRGIFEGAEAACCRLVGLKDGSNVSVRVCYEVETGQSHWRYLDVKTKMASASQQRAAGTFIAKTLARWWTGSSRHLRNELSEVQDASIEELLQELDPQATGFMTDGSDQDLARLIHLCARTRKFVVERWEGERRIELRVVPDLLCNPVVLHRLVRDVGFDYLIDSVLENAASALEEQARQRRPAEAAQGRQEVAALRALITLCRSMRQYLVKFPSTTIGSVLQKALSQQQQQQQQPEEEEAEYDMDEGTADAQNSDILIVMMQTRVRSMVRQATLFAASLSQHRIDDRETLQAASRMRRYIKAATEAGVFELLEGQDSGDIEAALDVASEKLEAWGQDAGKRRLSQLLAPQAFPPSPLSARHRDSAADAAKKDAAGGVSASAGDQAGGEGVVGSGADVGDDGDTDHAATGEHGAHARARAREQPYVADSPQRGSARDSSDACADAHEEAAMVSEVAALLDLGVMQGGSETMALLRLDLSVNLDDAALWNLQSVPWDLHNQGADAVSCARNAEERHASCNQDGIRALRSALLSAIYSSGQMQGLVARVVRLENLPATHIVRIVPTEAVARAATDPAGLPADAATPTGEKRSETLEAGETASAGAAPRANPGGTEAEDSEHGPAGDLATHDDGGEQREGVYAAEGGCAAEEAGQGQKERVEEEAVEVELEAEARSFALVQLSRTADTHLRVAAAATAGAGQQADWEPHASHTASALCSSWLKSQGCGLYGSLVVGAEAIEGLSCFIVLSLVVSMQDLIAISESDFAKALCADVAVAHASLTGQAAGGAGAEVESVSVIKMSSRRNYVILSIQEPDADMLTRAPSISRVSSSSHKVQRHAEVFLLNKLQDASLCASASKWVVSAVIMRGNIPPLMPGERAALKVFNSSTFSDMHSERDFLNAHVYPAMRGIGLDRRIDLSWIDFRWGGVTEDDSNNKLGIVRCLDKIQECSIPLQPGVSLPLVVALVGERCGWVPAQDAPERQEAARSYPWTLPARGAEFGQARRAFPRTDDYSKYSVTGLEMALAHFRFPHAAECFFFMRDAAFLASDTWKRLPKAARSAFQDLNPDPAPVATLPDTASAKPSEDSETAGASVEAASADAPLLGAGDAFSSRYLRSLVEHYGGGRVQSYSAAFGDEPYEFSTHLVMTKVRAKMKDAQEHAAKLEDSATATPNGIKEQLSRELAAHKREAVSWWLLLVEQETHEWRSRISDLEQYSPSDSEVGDQDGALQGEGAAEGAAGGEEAQEVRKARAGRLLQELAAFLAENRDTLEGWTTELGQAAPRIGNTNVAAKGVKLTTGTLAWAVMMSLMEVLDACYPEPCKMPGNAYYSVQQAQATYMEELSSTFVCLAQGSRIEALSRLDEALHPDERLGAVATVIVLLGEANSGRSALLARFLHNHLHVVRDKRTLELDYAFGAPQGGATPRAPNSRVCLSVHELDDMACAAASLPAASHADTASASASPALAETSWSRSASSSGRHRRCPLAPVHHRIVTYLFARLGHLADTEEVYAYLARDVAIQGLGKLALEPEFWERADASEAARYSRPGDTRSLGRRMLRFAILEVLARGTGVLIVLDGCTQEADLRAFAANMSDVAKEAGRRGIRAPAVLQCVVTSNVKLEGPAGARLCVKLGRLTLAEKQAVCRRWMARFGKDRVSEQQVMKAVRKAHSHLPLYLVLFCSEASLHAVFESIDDALEGYPEELEELWARSTLRRLEDGSHRALVAYFMQHLLAAPQGMSLRHIRACAARQAHLRAALPVAEQSQMIDFIAVNLRTFIYARDSDHIFLRSETLRQCTMARYAPRAMRHSQVVTRLEQVAAQGEGVWTAARNSIVHQPAHVDSARRQATTAAAAYDGRAEWAMDWVFDAVHRNLQVKMEGRQVSCMRGEDVVTALVQPEAAKDRCSYFEVKIESCGQVNIKVGFLINPTEQHLRRVPDRQAASQQANGWLFNCRNGNLVNKSIGNEWLKLAQSPHEPHPCVAKGSAIGLLVDPLKACVHLYVDQKRVPTSMPLSEAAKTALSDPQASIIFCVDLDNREQAVCITNREILA